MLESQADTPSHLFSSSSACHTDNQKHHHYLDSPESDFINLSPIVVGLSLSPVTCNLSSTRSDPVNSFEGSLWNNSNYDISDVTNDDTTHKSKIESHQHLNNYYHSTNDNITEKEASVYVSNKQAFSRRMKTLTVSVSNSMKKRPMHCGDSQESKSIKRIETSTPHSPSFYNAAPRVVTVSVPLRQMKFEVGQTADPGNVRYSVDQSSSVLGPESYQANEDDHSELLRNSQSPTSQILISNRINHTHSLATTKIPCTTNILDREPSYISNQTGTIQLKSDEPDLQSQKRICNHDDRSMSQNLAGHRQLEGTQFIQGNDIRRDVLGHCSVQPAVYAHVHPENYIMSNPIGGNLPPIPPSFSAPAATGSSSFFEVAKPQQIPSHVIPLANSKSACPQGTHVVDERLAHSPLGSGTLARQPSIKDPLPVISPVLKASNVMPIVDAGVPQSDASMIPPNTMKQQPVSPSVRRSQPPYIRETEPGPAVTLRAPCSCKKSRCLKLYCDCFRTKNFCDGCYCFNCANLEGFETERLGSMNEIVRRNPNAFTPRSKITPEEKAKNNLPGCSCRKSNCLKKYCECFNAGIKCSERCRCIDCQNIQAPAERSAANLGYVHEALALASQKLGVEQTTALLTSIISYAASLNFQQIPSNLLDNAEHSGGDTNVISES